MVDGWLFWPLPVSLLCLGSAAGWRSGFGWSWAGLCPVAGPQLEQQDSGLPHLSLCSRPARPQAGSHVRVPEERAETWLPLGPMLGTGPSFLPHILLVQVDHEASGWENKFHSCESCRVPSPSDSNVTNTVVDGELCLFLQSSTFGQVT